MLFLLLFHTSSIHLSIDFGSQFMKASIAKAYSNPEIAYNYNSKRLTPAYIALRNPKNINFSETNEISIEEGKLLTPFFGNDALEIMSNRPFLGSAFLFSYIGLSQNEKERISSSLFVNYTTSGLDFIELTTLFFKLYIDCISHNQTVDSISVVVPSTFTIPQRKEVEMIVRGAGFPFSSTIDDAESISNLYSIEKADKITTKPKTVLFIDVGSTSIKSYCIRFSISKSDNITRATRLSYSYSNEQGGAYLTKNIVLLIISKYKLKNLNEAEFQRLFNCAENIKIKLSLLKTVSLTVENISGADLEVKMTRYEIESVSLNFVKKTIETARKASKNIKFDSIEIIGGSSRIPILTNTIKDAFNIESIGHSLNSDESLSIGGGYFSQFKNGISKFEKVNILNKISPYQVSLRTYENTYLICEMNGQCLENLTITVFISQFEIVYDNVNKSLFESNSFGYRVNMTQNSILNIRFSKSLPIDVMSVQMCLSKYFCNFISFEDLNPLDESSFSSFHSIMESHECLKKVGQMRNKLENLTLRVIKEIIKNETVRNFTNNNQRNKILKIAQDSMKWIKEANSTADENGFIVRINEIEYEIGQVYTRIREDKKAQKNIMLMNNTLFSCRDKIKEWKKVNKNFNLGIDKLIKNLSDLINDEEKWLSNISNKINDTPNWKEKIDTNSEFKKRLKKLNNQVFEIAYIVKNKKNIKKVTKNNNKDL